MNLVMMDQDFDKLEGVIEGIDRSIGNVDINNTAACKYVGEIERNICTSKERRLAIVSVLPYLLLPKMVVVHLVYYVYIFLNFEVTPLGISKTLSSREIVLRRRLDWSKHCWTSLLHICMQTARMGTPT